MIRRDSTITRIDVVKKQIVMYAQIQRIHGLGSE